jgi:hypothetical protein
MEKILADIKSALNFSTADMWGAGGWIHMAERNRLTRAETGVANLKMVIQHAQRFDRSIQWIGPMEIASRHIMTDAIFNNIFSGMRTHDRIEASKHRLENAAAKLDEELKRANRRQGEREG